MNPTVFIWSVCQHFFTSKGFYVYEKFNKVLVFLAEVWKIAQMQYWKTKLKSIFYLINIVQSILQYNSCIKRLRSNRNYKLHCLIQSREKTRENTCFTTRRYLVLVLVLGIPEQVHGHWGFLEVDDCYGYVPDGWRSFVHLEANRLSSFPSPANIISSNQTIF